MAKEQKRSGNKTRRDSLQKLAVSGVSGFGPVTIRSEDGIWPSDLRPIVSHYAHIRGGIETSKKCVFCKKGMDSLAPRVPAEVPRGGVHGDSGTDEEEDTTPSFSDWMEEQN